ncbi:hypothetical protein G6F56_012134 [Rhizopus delemar]|nr:hypothetical protein G6F56_012134 [Rhizopus delemar]
MSHQPSSQPISTGPSGSNDLMLVDPTSPAVEPVTTSSLSSEVISEKSPFSSVGSIVPENFSAVDQINMAINHMSQDLVHLSLRLFGIAPGSEEETIARNKYKACNDDLKTLVSTRDSLITSSAYNTTAGPSWAEETIKQKQSHVVPRNLPLMQWKGSVFNSAAIVSMDIRDCLNKFQDLMACHGLSFDLNWRRLILPCFSPSQRTWFMEYQENETVLSWERFKQAFITQYGIGSAEEKAAATAELLHISMSASETVDQYIERFNNLRRLAHIQDACVVTRCFLYGLNNDIHSKVVVALANCPDNKKESVDYVIKSAKSIYNSLYRNRRAGNVTTTNESSSSSGKKRSVVSSASSPPK